jgi:CBS-domain-containing membrane protein
MPDFEEGLYPFFKISSIGKLKNPFNPNALNFDEKRLFLDFPAQSCQSLFKIIRSGQMEYLVKDVMVPISEYATVPEGSTLFQAVLALERAQEEFDNTKYRHRAILITDKNKRVVGKLSQHDVLRAIISGNHHVEGLEEAAQFGFSSSFIASIHEQYRPKGRSLSDICLGSSKMRVEDFMKAPSAGELIAVDASLAKAIYQLSRGNYLSLMVQQDMDIIGILRMTDVFAAIFHAMKENEKIAKA